MELFNVLNKQSNMMKAACLHIGLLHMRMGHIIILLICLWRAIHREGGIYNWVWKFWGRRKDSIKSGRKILWRWWEKDIHRVIMDKTFRLSRNH